MMCLSLAKCSMTASATALCLWRWPNARKCLHAAVARNGQLRDLSCAPPAGAVARHLVGPHLGHRWQQLHSPSAAGSHGAHVGERVQARRLAELLAAADAQGLRQAHQVGVGLSTEGAAEDVAQVVLDIVAKHLAAAQHLHA